MSTEFRKFDELSDEEIQEIVLRCVLLSLFDQLVSPHFRTASERFTFVEKLRPHALQFVRDGDMGKYGKIVGDIFEESFGFKPDDPLLMMDKEFQPTSENLMDALDKFKKKPE